jgi:hypothetical protein
MPLIHPRLRPNWDGRQKLHLLMGFDGPSGGIFRLRLIVDYDLLTKEISCFEYTQNYSMKC